jgi:predicted lipoprotein
MAETTLLALALSVQDAHARLVATADALPEEARFLIEEVDKRLKMMVATLREREQQLDTLHDTIADRINNLLMSIRTCSDLLRNGDPQITSVRERIDTTVENGRQTVKQLRDALGNVR